MGRRIALLAAIFVFAVTPFARADIRSDAVRLLAHRVRAEGVDPKTLVVSDVVVRGNQALLSWNSGKKRGVMGLELSADRWWDALDMTTTVPPTCWQIQNAYPLDPQAGLSQLHGDSRLYPKPICPRAPEAPDIPLHASGGTIHPFSRQSASGYDISIAYSKNNAAADAKLTRLYARPPTQAEFAPNYPPAPGWGGPDAVCFFDLTVNAAKPVTFERGTTIDIWFPFVLDDQLRYNLSFFSAGKPSPMIFGTVFDNTVHFVLPEFTLNPGQELMAEIDGDIKGRS